MFESLKLSDLPEKNCGILRHPTSTRPVIWVVEEGGKRAIVKDFSSNGFLYRNIIGRILIWRESKAYKRLNGVRGVPEFYRVIDGLALVVEKIEGSNAQDIEKIIGRMRAGPGSDVEELDRAISKFDGDFFDSLKVLTEKIHERGVAHCDLKRTPNIMLGDDGQPYIVDWASFMSESEFRFFPLNLIYRKFLQDDYMAVTKLKVNNRPDIATAEEIESYNSYKSRREKRGMEKAVRTIRSKLRSLLRKIA